GGRERQHLARRPAAVLARHAATGPDRGRGRRGTAHPREPGRRPADHRGRDPRHPAHGPADPLVLTPAAARPRAPEEVTWHQRSRTVAPAGARPRSLPPP